ncbi:MAG TPA: ATP-binding protein, partial [candidate division Zixibacteria bacterium]|nr:ATP-binding protein [candidate division Zixibacteria bacterium]
FVGHESPETLDAAELVAALKQHLAQHYRQNEVQWLEYPIPPGLVFTGYRRSLRQVLLNLLINGADACREAQKPIVLGLGIRRSHDAIELRVVDQGRGIPRRELGLIFEPFYTTRQSGSGLGLYLSRKIVEEMGGRLTVTSEPGRKTEVVVRLPQPAGE